MATTRTPSTRLVPSITQAGAILRLLGQATEPLGLSAIAKRLEISPSSCFNILKTLVEEDFATFNSTTKRYTIGLGVVQLARQALSRDAVVLAARPILQRLAEDMDAAVALWRVTGKERLTLVTLSEGESAARIHMAVGQRQPIGAGAAGRAILGARPISEAELRKAFDTVRWQGALDFLTYRDEVAAVRRQGYALDIDQMFQGITTLSAPIAKTEGGADYCLSISLFSRRHDSQGLGLMGEKLSQEAAEIAMRVFGARR